MGIFGGTNFKPMAGRRIAVVLATAILLLFGTSCAQIADPNTEFHLDQIRPEINNHGAMLTSPDSIRNGINELETGRYVDNTDAIANGTNGGIDGGVDGVGGNGDTTEWISGSSSTPLPAAGLGTGVYNRYLRDEIFEKLNTLVKENCGDNKVALWVSSCGYDNADPTASTIRAGANFERTAEYNNPGQFGGKAITKFAETWLGDINSNSMRSDTAVKQAVAAIDSSIKNYLASHPSVTEAQVKGMSLESVSSSNILDANYTKAWRFLCNGSYVMDQPTTLEKYITQIRVNPEWALPEYKLWRSSESKNSNNNLFDVSPVSENPGILKSSAKGIFTPYIQYPDHLAPNGGEHLKVNLWGPSQSGGYNDQHCLLFTHVDGFNKTMVMVCTDGTVSLKDALGDGFAEVEKIVNGAKPYTDIAGIASALGETDTNLNPMNSGSREVA